MVADEEQTKATMSESLIPGNEKCFKDLPDPRVTGQYEHKVVNRVVLTLCVVLCGTDG
jgi:hypothetical protein